MSKLKMTRKEALEIAMDAIQYEMAHYQDAAQLAAEGKPHYKRRAERYAELAAALQWIENASRQKDMGL